MTKTNERDGLAGLKCRGVGRMFDNEKALLVMFDRKPTDDELRAVHDSLATQPKPSNETAKLEICEGAAGLAVYLNNERIAGVRDNGLMHTIHSWNVRLSDLSLTTAAVPAEPSEVERVRDAVGGWALKHHPKLTDAAFNALIEALLAATPSQPAEPSEGVEVLLRRWLDWHRRADDDADDCEYLNDHGWDEAGALASETAKVLAALPNQPAESEDRHD